MSETSYRGVMPDWVIEKHATHDSMIQPYVAKQVRHNGDGEKIISYGLSSYGYDMRVANEWSYIDTKDVVIDVKNFNEVPTVNCVADVIDIPANSFVLARSIEYFVIPDNVMAICLGKSSYARTGLVVNTTPLEPGWKGHVTIELSNTTKSPLRVYANEGIAQVIFFGGELPSVTYGSRSGKYQGQTGIWFPRL